jgi:hypothetical protein
VLIHSINSFSTLPRRHLSSFLCYPCKSNAMATLMNHVMLLNFCAWGERLRHRRAKLQQRQAMREAKAAGWTIAGPDDLDDDDDNEGGVDLENEHNQWHTPEDAALKQHFPDAKTAVSKTANGRRNHHHSSSTTASTSFAGGRLKLFTPEYFEISADGTPRLCTSPESATAEMGPDDDDDDDDSTSSNAEPANDAASSSSSSNSTDDSDSSFLQILPENAPEASSALSPDVNAMLDRLQQLNHPRPNDGNQNHDRHDDGPAYEDEPPTTSTFTTLVTEDDSRNSTTKAEKEERPGTVADPTTTTSDQLQQLVVPAEESTQIFILPTDQDDDDRENNNNKEEEDIRRRSDSDDDDSDNSDDDSDDSVDYGGAETSVWQGVGQSFISAGNSVMGGSSTSSSMADNNNAVVVAATGGETATNNWSVTELTTVTTTTIPPPMTTPAKKNPLVITSTDRLVMDNYDHYDDSGDEDDDVDHQGAEVFLYTESKNKYNNNNYATDATTSTTTDIGGAVVSAITTTNKLFDITEAKQYQLDQHEKMTETARIIQESTAADNYDDLEFIPRLDDDDDDVDLTFTTSYKSPSATNKHSHLNLAEILLSPDNDNNSKNKPQSQQRDNLMSPLSAMVHPINLELFQNDDIGHDDNDDDGRHLDESFASSLATTTTDNNNNCDNWSVSSCPVSRRLSDMIPSGDRSVGSCRTSSSFRSSSIAGGRVRYSLSTGKRSMSKAQRQYSKDFLPKSLLVGLPPPAVEKERLPRSRTGAAAARSNKNKHSNNNNNNTLSVLLVDVQQHIFEVIAVDCYYKDDCTVGDVLSKARASATDPALSEQKYISLVYGQQEFAAPMLKIHAAVDFTINPDHTSRPLALAVPEGSNARQVQYIKMILWKNPKMKRWWNVEDPFMPIRMDSITEITVPSPKSLSATTTTQTTMTTDTNDDDQLLRKNEVVVSPNTSTENEEEDGNVEMVLAPAQDDHHDHGGAGGVVPPKEKNGRGSILRRRLEFVKWW